MELELNKAVLNKLPEAIAQWVLTLDSESAKNI